jgi:hypothetical protein
MSEWRELLLEPAGLTERESWVPWFDRIAERLLNGAHLVVAGEPHRLTEIEFYYHGPGHPDVFAHRDPVQVHTGRWYFHRTRGVYRSGSFKGLDLTFAGSDAFGGVLFRGLERSDGPLIDGPSLLVDYLLARTGAPDVAALDARIGDRVAWDADNPLRLDWLPEITPRPIYRSGRVGLSLKRSRKSPDPPWFILRRYRYLTEPARIRKGKLQLILALHARGRTTDEIRQITGATRSTVERYIADFEEGKRAADFGPYYGIELSPAALSRLHGVWQARYGAS